LPASLAGDKPRGRGAGLRAQEEGVEKLKSGFPYCSMLYALRFMQLDTQNSKLVTTNCPAQKNTYLNHCCPKRFLLDRFCLDI